MISIRTTLTIALTALTLSCGGGSTTSPQNPIPKPNPNPTPGQIDLSIASVTLADDCGSPPTTAPTVRAKPVSQDPSLFASQAARACQQSSVQFRVANGTTEPSKITIKKVELLDESGAVLRELTPRDASQWSNDTYQAWDEQVGPNQVLQVSYSLSAPLASRGGTYTLRVTMAAGDGERTVEQKTTLQAEASLPPGAVT